MDKILSLGEAARGGLVRGALGLAEAVARAYGPGGRAVVIGRRYGLPEVTRSGSAAAKAVEFADGAEEAGAAIMRAMAAEVAEGAGGGATAAIVLAASLLSGGMRLIEAGADAAALRRGVLLASREAAGALRAMSRPASGREDIERAAAIAAGDASLGRLAASALESVNFRGAVSVRASGTGESFVQHEEGMSFDRGWFSPYMSTDFTSMEADFTDAAVFLSAKKLERVDELLPLLDEAARAGVSLLVIAEELSQDVLTSMLSNISRKTIRLCAAKAPGYALGRRPLLEDIAAFTGGTVFGTELEPELRRASLDKCGRASRVRVTRDNTFIYGGAGDGAALERYVHALRVQLDGAKNLRERDELTERIARLTDGTAVIRVGAASEAGRAEATERVTAALAAAVSATRGGLLPGGGVAYLRASKRIESFAAGLDGDGRLGVQLLASSLAEPAARIAANAGFAPGPAVERARASLGAIGFDAAAGRFRDMFRAGIVDPAEALVLALEKAAGAAAQILTAGAAVLDRPQPRAEEPVPDNIHVTPSDLM